jgi:hypothetical protein
MKFNVVRVNKPDTLEGYKKMIDVSAIPLTDYRHIFLIFKNNIILWDNLLAYVCTANTARQKFGNNKEFTLNTRTVGRDVLCGVRIVSDT